MKIWELEQYIQENDPDAEIVVIVAGHSIDISHVDGGVANSNNPYGVAEIILKEAGSHNQCVERRGR